MSVNSTIFIDIIQNNGEQGLFKRGVVRIPYYILLLGTLLFFSGMGGMFWCSFIVTFGLAVVK